MIRMILMFVLAAFIGCTSTGKVTETGNPCPTDNCPAAKPSSEGGDTDIQSPANTAGLSWYRNDEFKVYVGYISNWIKTEVSSGSVEFTNVEDVSSRTEVVIAFEKVAASSTLGELMTPASCNGSLTVFGDNPYLTTGYKCDITSSGPRGGDLVDYYFLSGTTFIHVYAEIFESGVNGFSTIVKNIAPI